VPAHDQVQFDVQLPLQVDCPSHVVVQPVPHDASHVFFESHWYVAPFGGAAAPAAVASAPPSEPLGPKLHVPPALHEQVVPEHEHAPEQVRSEPAALPPPQPLAEKATTLAAMSVPARNVDRAFDMLHLQRTELPMKRVLTRSCGADSIAGQAKDHAGGLRWQAARPERCVRLPVACVDEPAA
jgi:hypothetical protein